ncbi:MAG: DUF3999 family protein, partial [Saprospiraceae bacterium]|nr:DUF3999 family protein [Saprospiraceae bacterium]
MMKIKVIKTLIFLCFCSIGVGQADKYKFRRPIKDVTTGWQKITLPADIYAKVSFDLSDLRIYGFRDHDSIEVPYFLDISEDRLVTVEIDFRIINQSNNSNGHYFTFELEEVKKINNIQLSFGQQNFDWQVKLEGSQDQKEWYTLVENYRIMSISNDITNFKFDEINFPEAAFRYFRISIKSNVKPDLLHANIFSKVNSPGKFSDVPIRKIQFHEDKANKKTVIDINLTTPSQISRLQFDIQNDFDYYRPITIQYLADSIPNANGTKYQYFTLTSGMLNSLEKSSFNFERKTVKELKIIVDNHDNPP